LISSRNPNQAYTINISEVGIAAKNFGTLASVPGAPTGLSATGGYQQVTLNWSAPNDGGSPITNYEIYRSTSPGGETFLKEIGNVTSTIDTGLTNGTTYYYQVSAKNSKGEGPKSGEVSAVPGDTTPPTAGTVTPTNISYGSYVDTPFDLSTVFTDNESAVTACEYTTSTNWYAATVSGSSPNYTCSKTGITSSNGSVLSLNMRATSAGGTTTATAVSRTVDGAAPTDGTLTATAGDQQVSLSWTAATDSGSGLATTNTYKLVFSTTGSPAVNCIDGTQIYLGTGTSYNHTGLTNGTTYYYRVCAYDAVDNVSNGATGNGTPAFFDPTPPTAGTVTPANTSYGSYVSTPFDLSTVFTDNESAVTSCEYTTSTNWYAATVLGSGPNYTCSKTGIIGANGANLSLNMRATSAGGTTTATAVSRTVDGAAPTDGVLTPTAGDQQISLSWTAASDSGSGLATTNTYKLVFSTVSSPSPVCTDGTQIFIGTSTSYIHTGLTNGTTYYYRVCATDAVNNISTGATTNATPTTYAFNRYWVGGTGNWSDIAHWSDTPGGAGGATVPTLGYNVYFNANSFTAASQTVTINTTANVRNLDWTGVTNTPTLAGSSALNISGSLTLVSGMIRTYGGSITFNATSTGKTISLGGKTLNGYVYFNGAGGEWTLLDDFNDGSNYYIYLRRGSLNTNSKTVTAYGFYYSTAGTSVLNLGGSAINLISNWNFSATSSLTFYAGTSTITFNGVSPTFYGGNLTYNNVVFSGSGSPVIYNANTFANLTRIGTAATTDGLTIYTTNQTITGILTLTGNSVTNRLLIQSSTLGSSRTLTAAAVALTNVDFQDIAAGGAATWSGTSVGNCAGNTGIIAPPNTRYWVATAGGSWSVTSSWSNASGGPSGASIPTCSDVVVFDANSITSTGRTITHDVLRFPSINFANVLNSPTLTLSTTKYIYGSLDLTGLGNLTGNYSVYFYGRGSNALKTSGRTLYGLGLYAPGSSLTLQGDLLVGNSGMLLYYGTFTANNFNVTSSGNINAASGAAITTNMGNGLWTINSTGGTTIWNFNSASATLNAGLSTLKINIANANTYTFNGGSKVYNNLWVSGAGTGTFVVQYGNTFRDFTIDANKNVNFTANYTQTITGIFKANGSSGNLINLRSTASGTKWTINIASATTTYVSVQDSTATGAGSPISCQAINLGNDFSDGFEDATLDPFTTDGSANWYTTTTSVYSGTYSAKAGTITHNQSTNMYLTQTIGTGGRYINFARRVSSESCCDYLRFYIDGVQPSGAQWAGTINWGTVSYYATAGSHTFRWTYSKDGSVSSGSDTAWVDEVLIQNLDGCINNGNNTGWTF
jgi:hypothetical protein